MRAFLYLALKRGFRWANRPSSPDWWGGAQVMVVILELELSQTDFWVRYLSLLPRMLLFPCKDYESHCAPRYPTLALTCTPSNSQQGCADTTSVSA